MVALTARSFELTAPALNPLWAASALDRRSRLVNLIVPGAKHNRAARVLSQRLEAASESAQDLILGVDGDMHGFTSASVQRVATSMFRFWIRWLLGLPVGPDGRRLRSFVTYSSCALDDAGGMEPAYF